MPSHGSLSHGRVLSVSAIYQPNKLLKFDRVRRVRSVYNISSVNTCTHSHTWEEDPEREGQRVCERTNKDRDSVVSRFTRMPSFIFKAIYFIFKQHTAALLQTLYRLNHIFGVF